MNHVLVFVLFILSLCSFAPIVAYATVSTPRDSYLIIADSADDEDSYNEEASEDAVQDDSNYGANYESTYDMDGGGDGSGGGVSGDE